MSVIEQHEALWEACVARCRELGVNPEGMRVIAPRTWEFTDEEGVTETIEMVACEFRWGQAWLRRDGLR